MSERSIDAPPMRWWGWGDPNHPSGLPPHALRFLSETVGVGATPTPPVALEHVQLQASGISAAALEALRDIVGDEHVCGGHAMRVLHAAGKGYPDLVRMRRGEPACAPDVVVYPASHEQLRGLLQECSRLSVAVVPFGGGTSVVGGVEPLRGRHDAVVALDMSRLANVVKLDEESLTITVQAGMPVRQLEQLLAGKQLTLGHFPQSFEYVTLGGCAATRSAGQASTGYGRFETMVRGLRLAAPAGDIELPALPASAAGPSLRELIIGSEGTLGVIDELSLRVRHAPQKRIYEGAFFESFQEGAQALRELAQRHVAPDVARLSDAEETRMSLALSDSGKLKDRFARTYLNVRGYRTGCLAIFGFEGDAHEVDVRRKRAQKLVTQHDGLLVGRSPGESWLTSRFSAPYLRDELLTHAVMVETLETATSWSNLTRLHGLVGAAIGQALRACGTPGLVMCHISHLYETGASLYFTFLARQAEDPIAQWLQVKTAASQAIVDGGGTITHHHAVGRDHAPWIASELGDEGVAALRALKAELDPKGIMNPGKLLV